MSHAPAVQALVAIPLPIATEAFSYLVPDERGSKAVPGVRVRVPFRNREITGYLVSLEKTGDPESGARNPQPKPSAKPQGKVLKPILAVIDDHPVLSPAMLALTKWVADYYGSSWGEAIENALPRWVKFGKKAAKYIEKASLPAETPPEPAPREFELTAEQKKAFEIISAAIGKRPPVTSPSEKGGPEGISKEKSSQVPLCERGESPGPLGKPILLFGVTGSGKSELYIRSIRETLRRGRGAICLVPEIALTEQIKRFFAGHFGDKLEILHSKMTDGERFLAWKRIELGTARVVLGPRSAVFAPVPDLGLIIMDEEHEGSYKQETVPRYHAREVAAWRARHERALFLMGTATPSFESMRAAETGEVTRVDLTQRIDRKALPKVELIDLRRYEGEKRASWILTPPLMREIGKNLAAGEGTMLLLNRRGFSTSIRCKECGETEKCKSCQVSLTYHQEAGLLLCHYCNYRKKVPDTCSSCKAPILKFMGFGTEKVESEVAKFFPKARIVRLDADTTRKKDAHELILSEFRDRKVDILIGTQMIAKGFDFPHVTLVGVVLADVGLRLPDFRSGERTFQLLTQFAGRAGRGSKPGRVLIQTCMPDHPSVALAKNHDFLGFYAHETRLRRDFKYPPYCSLINIIIRSRTENKAYQFAREMRDALREKLRDSFPRTGPASQEASPESQSEPFGILGPAPLPFYKLRGHFRWHIMLKLPLRAPETGSKGMPGVTEIYKLLMGLKKPSSVAFAIDVDPLNIL
ncbi:MAG TPA: primosomal protein N' [Candidatus Omnitrophota bacterium]|nr:primosomal protein N' [Candidatus Omnitrophota bacterium]